MNGFFSYLSDSFNAIGVSPTDDIVKLVFQVTFNESKTQIKDKTGPQKLSLSFTVTLNNKW